MAYQLPNGAHISNHLVRWGESFLKKKLSPFVFARALKFILSPFVKNRCAKPIKVENGPSEQLLTHPPHRPV
jgi:hypothetical protein